MPHPILSLREFRDGGYLQEVNRNVLHPLGLALAVRFPEGANPDTAEPTSMEVYDYRDDEEGMLFGPARNEMEASDRMSKAGKVEAEINAKREKRAELFGGDVVQGVDSLIQIRAQAAEPPAELPE